MTAIKARLDKDGARVLCGVKDCGTEIGQVLVNGVWREGKYRPAVWLPAGWKTTDYGVWELSRHAQSRVRSGKAAAERTSPRRAYGLAGPLGTIPTNLPVVVVCPSCKFPQALDPVALGVDPVEESSELLLDKGHQGRTRLLFDPMIDDSSALRRT